MEYDRNCLKMFTKIIRETTNIVNVDFDWFNLYVEAKSKLEGSNIVCHIHDHILGHRVNKAWKDNLKRQPWKYEEFVSLQKLSWLLGKYLLIGTRALKCIISTGIPGVAVTIIPAMSIVRMNRAMVTISSEHPTILMRSWCIGICILRFIVTLSV